MMCSKKAKPNKSLIAFKAFIISYIGYLIFSVAVIVIVNFGFPPLGLAGYINTYVQNESMLLQYTHSYESMEINNKVINQLSIFQSISNMNWTDSELKIFESQYVLYKNGKQNSSLSKYENIFKNIIYSTEIVVAKEIDNKILVGNNKYTNNNIKFLMDNCTENNGIFKFDNDIVYYTRPTNANNNSYIFLFVNLINKIDKNKNNIHFVLNTKYELTNRLMLPFPDDFILAKKQPIAFDIVNNIVDKNIITTLNINGHMFDVIVTKFAVDNNSSFYYLSGMSMFHIWNKIIIKLCIQIIGFTIIALLIALLTQVMINKKHHQFDILPQIIESMSSNESVILDYDKQNDLSGIYRALSSLANKIKKSKFMLEEEFEDRMKMLQLTADLCSVYAKDISETANVAAVNLLKQTFNADSAALFYVNAEKAYHYCPAGTSFPIVLPELRWRECVQPHSGEAEVARFGPWSLPGLEKPITFWMSYRLYSFGIEGGYIFLGKTHTFWSSKDEADLIVIAKAIVPIIKVRRDRELEEHERKVVEISLATNEKRLRTFLEGSRDMIYTANAEDTVTDINAAGANLLRYVNKENIIGKNYSKFTFNAEDRKLLLSKVQEFGYASDYEIVMKKSDGNTVFCLETAYAIRDANGKIIELQGIVKDISERIANETALWRSNIELADTNLKYQRAQSLMVQQEKLASIGQLAAGVAHEINNPLAFLKSNHVMLEKYIKKIIKAWNEAKATLNVEIAAIDQRMNFNYLITQIETILVESDEGFGRITHIVSNLKSFSRNDKAEEYNSYDVNAGIESTLIVARNEIKYVAEIRKELNDLPLIAAIGSEINQVFLNIFVNAAQAIESQKRETKGLIEVKTSNLGNRILIEIKDDGPGIPKELYTKIFDPFFTTKEPGKGTGLGLSISYDIIVAKHNGKITVDSNPTGGTLFLIELPIARPPIENI